MVDAHTDAESLPQGSIVAELNIAYLRILPGVGYVWRGTDGRRYDDSQINDRLTSGAVVLRLGYPA